MTVMSMHNCFLMYQELFVQPDRQAALQGSQTPLQINVTMLLFWLLLLRVCVFVCVCACVCIRIQSIGIRKHQLKMAVGVIVIGEIPNSHSSGCLRCHGLPCHTFTLCLCTPRFRRNLIRESFHKIQCSLD